LKEIIKSNLEMTEDVIEEEKVDDKKKKIE